MASPGQSASPLRAVDTKAPDHEARQQFRALTSLIRLAQDVYHNDMGGSEGLFAGALVEHEAMLASTSDEMEPFERCTLSLAASAPPVAMMRRTRIRQSLAAVCRPQLERVVRAGDNALPPGTSFVGKYPRDSNGEQICPRSGLALTDWRARVVAAIVRDRQFLPALFWWIFVGEQLSLKASALLVRMIHLKGETGLNWPAAMLLVTKDEFGDIESLYSSSSHGSLSGEEAEADNWWGTEILPDDAHAWLDSLPLGPVPVGAVRRSTGPRRILDAISDGYTAIMMTTAEISSQNEALGFGIRDQCLDWFNFVVSSAVQEMFARAYEGTKSVLPGRPLHPSRINSRIRAVLTSLTTGSVGGVRQWKMHQEAAKGGKSDSVKVPGVTATDGESVVSAISESRDGLHPVWEDQAVSEASQDSEPQAQQQQSEEQLPKRLSLSISTSQHSSQKGSSRILAPVSERTTSNKATTPDHRSSKQKRLRKAPALVSKGSLFAKVAINGRLVTRGMIRKVLSELSPDRIAGILSASDEELGVLADIAAARTLEKLRTNNKFGAFARSSIGARFTPWDLELQTTPDGRATADTQIPLPELPTLIVELWRKEEAERRSHPELLTLRSVRPRALGGRAAGMKPPAGGEGDVLLFSEAVAQSLAKAHEGGSGGGASSLRSASNLAVHARMTKILLFGSGGRPLALEEAGMQWTSPEKARPSPGIDLAPAVGEVGLGADWMRVEFGLTAYDTTAKSLAPSKPTPALHPQSERIQELLAESTRNVRVLDTPVDERGPPTPKQIIPAAASLIRGLESSRMARSSSSATFLTQSPLRGTHSFFPRRTTTSSSSLNGGAALVLEQSNAFFKTSSKATVPGIDNPSYIAAAGMFAPELRRRPCPTASLSVSGSLPTLIHTRESKWTLSGDPAPVQSSVRPLPSSELSLVRDDLADEVLPGDNVVEPVLRLEGLTDHRTPSAKLRKRRASIVQGSPPPPGGGDSPGFSPDGRRSRFSSRPSRASSRGSHKPGTPGDVSAHQRNDPFQSGLFADNSLDDQEPPQPKEEPAARTLSPAHTSKASASSKIVSATRAFVTHLTGITQSELDQPVRPPSKDPGSSTFLGDVMQLETKQSMQNKGQRSFEEKRLVHDRVLSQLKRGAKDSLRSVIDPAGEKNSVSVTQVLHEINPANRPRTHLVSMPTALAAASERRAQAMKARYEQSQRRSRQLIAQSRRQRLEELKEIEEEKEMVMKDKDAISSLASEYRSTVSADFAAVLKRNHLDSSASAVALRREPMDTDPVGDGKDAADEHRGPRARPWRASANALEHARRQNGGRYVPPEKRAEEGTLAFSRAELDRLKAIERAGASQAGKAIAAAEFVRKDRERRILKLQSKFQSIQQPSGRTVRARSVAVHSPLSEEDDSDDNVGDGNNNGSKRAQLLQDKDVVPVQVGSAEDLLEAAVAVRRVASALGVDTLGTVHGTLEKAVSKLARWGVVDGSGSASSTFAAPVKLLPEEAARALSLAGDLDLDNRSLQRTMAALDLAFVSRARRIAEEPQVTDSAMAWVGKAIKGGGVPYNKAKREGGLAAGPVAKGRRLGMSLAEILLLSKSVAHRSKRRTLDNADNEIRRQVARERAEASRARLEEARRALSGPLSGTMEGARSLTQSSEPIIQVGVDGSQARISVEDQVDDLTDAWQLARQVEEQTPVYTSPLAQRRGSISRLASPSGAAAKSEHAAESKSSRLGGAVSINTQARTARLKESDESKTPASVAVSKDTARSSLPAIGLATSLVSRHRRRFSALVSEIEAGHEAAMALAPKPGSLEARRMRRQEESQGRSLGLANRISLLKGMMKEVATAMGRIAREKTLSPRVFDPADVAGVGLDDEEDEDAAVERRRHLKLRRKWRKRAVQRRRVLARGSAKAADSAFIAGDMSSSDEDDPGHIPTSGVAQVGWQPTEQGRMTMSRAKQRLMSRQIEQRSEEDARLKSSQQFVKSLPDGYTEWPAGALGPRGEAIALPEYALDDALEEATSATRRAKQALNRLRSSQQPRLGEKQLTVSDSKRADSDEVASIRTFRSNELLGAGERSALESLGKLPTIPKGKDAFHVIVSDEFIAGRDGPSLEDRRAQGVPMQRHEVQLELRALLEQRYKEKVRVGETSRVGRGLERVYVSKLITNRSLDDDDI
jgi:hypothetical protein